VSGENRILIIANKPRPLVYYDVAVFAYLVLIIMILLNRCGTFVV